MGRPRKLEPSVLVALVDGYYEEKAAGNAAKIRFSSLEAYAEEKGYTVKSYDFSRCREAVVRIEELKNSEEMRREETLAAAYKSLDVEGLLKQCTTVEALKETLIRMDGYWKRTYMEASALITRDRAFMQEKGKLDGKIRSLKEENARPEIVGTMPDVSKYDVIFFGYPIWWHDLPMVCYTFFDKVKLEGKTVAPFCTHEGSGLSDTDRFIAKTTGAAVTEALEMYGTKAQNWKDEAKQETLAWLKKIGYEK